MTVAELISKLSAMPDWDAVVMMQDSIGKADINSGPYETKITQDDEDNCGDCAGRVGEQVVVLGA